MEIIFRQIIIFYGICNKILILFCLPLFLFWVSLFLLDSCSCLGYISLVSEVLTLLEVQDLMVINYIINFVQKSLISSSCFKINKPFFRADLDSQQNWAESTESVPVFPASVATTLSLLCYNPHWSGTFVMIYEPILTHHCQPKSKVYIRVHSLYSLFGHLMQRVLCILSSFSCVCLTFCDPMDCSPPGSSVQGILQARISGVGCHALLQGILPTQRLNPCILFLLHWSQILFTIVNWWGADSLEKTLMLGTIEGKRRRGDRVWDGYIASPTQWTWILASSRR